MGYTNAEYDVHAKTCAKRKCWTNCCDCKEPHVVIESSGGAPIIVMDEYGKTRDYTPKEDIPF